MNSKEYKFKLFWVTLIVLACLPYISMSATVPKIQYKNCQKIWEGNWLYKFDGFMVLLPFQESLIKLSYSDNDHQHIMNNIISVYPRNYQTLTVLALQGYGIEELISLATTVSEDSYPSQVILKDSVNDFRWTRKNIYFNNLENKANIFNIKLGDRNKIISKPFLSSSINQIMKSEFLQENSEFSVQANFIDFINYYFSSKLRHPDRIKNLAIFIDVDTVQELQNFIKQICEIVKTYKVKIQSTIIASSKWSMKSAQFQLQISKNFKISAYRIVIQSSNLNQIEYSLLKDHGIQSGSFKIQTNDIFIYSIQNS